MRAGCAMADGFSGWLKAKNSQRQSPCVDAGLNKSHNVLIISEFMHEDASEMHQTYFKMHYW